MSSEAREWLPSGALADAAVQGAVARALGDWSAAWFPGPPLKVLGSRVLEARSAQPASHAEWRVHGRAVAIAHVPEIMSALARRALAASPGDATVSDTDRELVDGFVQRMLGDLALKLEQVLAIEGEERSGSSRGSDPVGPAGALLISAGARDAGAGELSLAIPLDALVAFRKRKMRAVRNPERTFDNLRAAIGGSKLAIEASLGEAELSIAELRGLAAGDVVVLDRSFRDPAKLLLRGSRTPFATGSLSGTGDSVSLILDK